MSSTKQSSTPDAQAKRAPSVTPNTPQIALARLAEVTGANDETGTSISVHFNPASLQLQLSNELKDTKNNERKQYVSKTSAKLSMELQFDTTDTGEPVTESTNSLQAFIAPPPPSGDQSEQSVPPPLVLFEWGTIAFKGIVESYSETIDYFSAEGVPLRSVISLTLSRQDQVFDESPGKSGESKDDNDSTQTTPQSAAEAANKLSSPNAARSLAAANGQENLRFGTGASLNVSSQVQLKPPAAFASAEAGVSGNLSGGLSLGADLGLGVGMSASAKLSATEGAFAGLKTKSTGPSHSKLNLSKLQKPPAGCASPTDAAAQFQTGGKAVFGASAGLRADVGINSKLTFS